MKSQPSTLFQSKNNLVGQCPACSSLDFSNLIQTKVQMHPSEMHFQFQQCQECDLVFLNPRPSIEELKEFYTDYYLPYRGPEAWGRFASFVRGSQQKLDKQRVRLVNSFHPLTKESIVLDVGCGKPTFLKTCLNRYGCQTLGLDFADTGWKDNPEAFEGVELFIGQVKDLSADQRPSVITMWHYLEHDYDPLETLQRLRRLAAPGTTLIIEIPNYDSTSRRLFGENWAGYHTPRHTFLFSPNNISQLLIRAGWQVEEVRTEATLDPYLLYWMSRMEQKNIDWSLSMENRFIDFLWGKLRFEWEQRNQKAASLGMMLVVGKA
jgi:ubiquinone/menaquinone biosynthesis C-methylase UbiE